MQPEIAQLHPTLTRGRFNPDCSLRGARGVSDIITEYTPPAIESDLPGLDLSRHGITGGEHAYEKDLGKKSVPSSAINPHEAEESITR